MSKIPVHGLQHITVVVNDARASAQKYATIHGVATWTARRFDGKRLSETTTHGFQSDHGYLSALGTVDTPTGPVTFELVQPLSGWTTYHEFLNTRGEGIHSVCTAVLAPHELEEVTTALATAGVGIAQSSLRDQSVYHVLFDTRKKLGGFYVEVLSSPVGGSPEDNPQDEVWNFPTLRPAVMELGGVVHLGVVVPDLMSAAKNYAELFGQETFSFRNWQPAPGSLDRPTYLGHPVHHAYFTTMVTPHEQLAFEVIQPTIGPSHYKEDFLVPLGPGIHHLHGGMQPDVATWDALRARMQQHGVPVVMSGGILNNFIDFYYLDTRAALAGYVVEVVVPGETFAQGRPNVPFAMVADFSQPSVV